MLTLAAFASLAQFGAGLALALAIFVEPISVRENSRRKSLENQIKLLPNLQLDTVTDRANDLYTQIYDLEESVKTARSKSTNPLLLIKAGVVLNFALLVCATITPEAEVSLAWMWTILSISISPVLGGMAWMEYIAQSTIGKKRFID